jgi:starch phosphorylase
MFQNKLDFKQDFERRLSEKYGRSVPDSHVTERYDILGEMVRDYAGYYWRNCREDIMTNGRKQCIYFSMEFLMGRLLVSNMQNLGIYKVAKDGLADMGIDINELEDMEPDAGLGNGGLGRLAACFLDSAASLGYPVHGNTIRYEYGFFRQKFVDGKQVELPDQWLSDGFVFEVRKPKHAVEVKFYGNAETYLRPDGTYALRTVNARCIRAVPYDVSVVGYRNGVCNSLRLWSAEPSEENLPTDCTFNEYLSTLKVFCHVHHAMSGVVFSDYQTVKERIEATSTKTGLTVVVRLNLQDYQKGIKVDKTIKEDRRIQYHPKIPDLNYRINP